ncbi:uncharacterized protein JN550_007706 [Neoarthrinium moseri]|uniref:uncharacterized protein n=1 Tax=Neoarthrinium moseri TaxID=1658444 RepID=UPI001FDD0FAB|nr:uncharacterized protein JN550_007706 [Neoarthrinium moseri]KAI1866318.1 hypothetical protein JN550_007706 [Neoarthrinium moseri]
MRNSNQGGVLILDLEKPESGVQTFVSLKGSTGQTGIAPLGGGLHAISGGLHSPFHFKLGSMSMLNGMAVIRRKPHIVLSADSIGGRIWRINTQTRAVDVVVADDELGLDSNPVNFIPLGANGLGIIDDCLCFINSARGTFARFKVDKSGNKIGDIEIIVQND